VATVGSVNPIPARQRAAPGTAAILCVTSTLTTCSRTDGDVRGTGAHRLRVSGAVRVSDALVDGLLTRADERLGVRHRWLLHLAAVSSETGSPTRRILEYRRAASIAWVPADLVILIGQDHAYSSCYVGCGCWVSQPGSFSRRFIAHGLYRAATCVPLACGSRHMTSTLPRLLEVSS
jgi:hypothetical protein